MVAAERAPLLEVRDIEFSYGPLQVLFGVGIDVLAGHRVALLGVNGAGKSTLLKVIAGLAPPDRGRVFFKGQEVTHAPPDRRVALGMVMVPGGRATFPSLSVYESLSIGAYRFMRDRATTRRRIDEALDLFPVLRPRLRQRAGTLSGGEQQMVALARALITGPELLMIDELSLGLAPLVVKHMVDMVDEIVSRGTTLLVVEQSLNVATLLAEHAFFMEKGEIRFSGPIAELVERGDLVRSVFLAGEVS